MDTAEKKALFEKYDSLTQTIANAKSSQEEIIKSLLENGETKMVEWKGHRLTPVKGKTKSGGTRYYFRESVPKVEVL